MKPGATDPTSFCVTFGILNDDRPCLREQGRLERLSALCLDGEIEGDALDAIKPIVIDCLHPRFAPRLRRRA